MAEDHTDDEVENEGAAVRTARAPAPAAVPSVGSDGFDPYAKLFLADGRIDPDYLRKRIPSLVDLLRHHPALLSIRVDHEELGRRLLDDEAAALRDAADQSAFEEALAGYSRAHLHDLLDDDILARSHQLLRTLSLDVELSRRDRVAAAIGLTFVSGAPDTHGVVGRAFFDLVFRVSLEELHAQERLRQLAAETEGGLSPEELETFWKTYPALRYAYEQRYRREVTRVLQQIEEGNFPLGISIDLALRGIHRLQAAALEARESGAVFDQVAAQKSLREPFGNDMLDGGPETATSRWRRAADTVQGSARDRRAYVRTVDSAIRLVQDGGPGGEAVLFYTYLHAIVEGQFHIEEQEEAEVARGVFDAAHGLATEGVIGYADYHVTRGRTHASRRLVAAAFEIWPDDDRVRTLAERHAQELMEEARATPQGPLYEEGDVTAETIEGPLSAGESKE